MNPDYMSYMTTIPEQMMQAMAFAPENIPAFIAMALCSTGGFLVYIWALKMIVKEKTDPYPLWLHCWMITWDAITSVTCWIMAFNYDFFWLFVMFGVFEPIWVIMEAICIYQAVKQRSSREEEFADITDGPVTKGQAWFYVVGMLATGFALNMWAFSMLGGPQNGVWILCPITNYVIALWSWRFWRRRAKRTGTREGNSLTLQIILAVEITLMWVPGLSWWLALTQFDHQLWFYVIGIVSTCVAVYNLWCCAKLPKANAKKAEAALQQ